MDVTSYLLGKQAGGGTPINNQNKDVTITENGTTTVSADAGYTGLGTVGITANVQPDLESKSVTITENGTTTVTPTTGKDGLSQVSITTNVSGGGIDEYFNNTLVGGDRWITLVKKLPSPLIVNGTSANYMFNDFKGATIPTISGTILSQVTNMGSMFNNCSNITSLDLSSFDTSNVTDMSSMFNNCSNLTNITFGNSFNTSNVTFMSNMFTGCNKLETLDISNFDMGKVINVSSIFSNTNSCKLTNLRFGYDLGKGYLTTRSAHYYAYGFNLQYTSHLTHDSLMSIINGLYDIASLGVQTQDINLGSTYLSMLSQAEKDIATNKGWTLL